MNTQNHNAFLTFAFPASSSLWEVTYNRDPTFQLFKATVHTHFKYQRRGGRATGEESKGAPSLNETVDMHHKLNEVEVHFRVKASKIR